MSRFFSQRSFRAGFAIAGAFAFSACSAPSVPPASAPPTNAPVAAATAAPAVPTSNVAGAKVAFPATIKATAILDLTGPAGFAGIRCQDGLQFALDEINSSGVLGSSKIALDVIDSGSSKQQAIDAMTRTANDESVMVVLGPIIGSSTLAAAPIAQSKGLPEIAIESGTPGVVETGNFVFRVTPLQINYIGVTTDYLVKNKGTKKVAIMYDDTNGTVAALGKDAFPREFQSRGATITGSETFTPNQMDYSSVITKLLSGNPDTFGILAVGADNATIIGQLRQAGFDGPIFGQTAMSAGNLNPVAAQAEGTVWSVFFDPTSSFPSTQKFVQNWTAKKSGDVPNAYAAESYDAMYLLANALQQAPSATREGIRQGIEAATSAGYDGAVGHYTYKDRDAQMGGHLLMYHDGKETFVH